MVAMTGRYAGRWGMRGYDNMGPSTCEKGISGEVGDRCYVMCLCREEFLVSPLSPSALLWCLQDLLVRKVGVQASNKSRGRVDVTGWLLFCLSHPVESRCSGALAWVNSGATSLG